jgi:hypothetical protein
MKIFISYKQSGLSDRELQSDLSIFKEILESKWHEAFVYYFDADYINRTPKDIIYTARDQINKSDIVVWFVNHSWKSEWMMEELGIAFWLEKDIKLIVNTEFEDEYFLSYWISSETFLFSNNEELKNIISNQLIHD